MSDTDKPKQPDLITALAQYKDDLALFHGPPKLYVQGRVDGFADGYNKAMENSNSEKDN
jgi:hypothetical protein